VGRLLDSIDSPADLKRLDISQLETLCREVRDYMIECCAHNPGHLGASLGAVEIAVALHYVYDTPSDKIVWDVGHQAYAHKIITGRRELFRKNRTADGISGFPKRSESGYDAFGTGHSSTSVSAALGMAVAAALAGRREKTVAVIGDGAMTGGLAYEGLDQAGFLKSDILVILNDNGISIDPTPGALHNHLLKITASETYNNLKTRIWHRMSDTLRRSVRRLTVSTKMALLNSPRGSLFESLGMRYFGTVDGNDIRQMVEVLRSMKGIGGPKLLHVITKKGKGYAPAENDQETWHAPGRFDPASGLRLPKASKADKYQDVFGQTLVEMAGSDRRIVAVTPAMVSGSGLSRMMETFPDRTFDVGIAEQHAVTFSAGLAAGGLLPYCCIYSTFMQRGYDGIIHDVALQGLKVVFCLDRGGLVGEDGPTHHGAFDLAYGRLIPDIAVASPINELELRNLVWSAASDGYPSIMIRYPRGEGEGVPWRDEPFSGIPLGKAVKLSEGEDVGILSIGPVGNRVCEAVEYAERHGVTARHYDMRFLKPLDTEAVDGAARTGTVITVEDGTVIGGLHGAVAEYLGSTGFGGKIIAAGIPDRFIGQGKICELHAECGLDTESMIKLIFSVKNEK